MISRNWSCHGCCVVVLMVVGMCGPGTAQELVLNGDFEDQAFVSDGVPLLDGQGNPRPTSWFYADSSPPSPVVTEWIEGDDADGSGTHSAATYTRNVDWRSEDYEVVEGETLQVSYAFKFSGVTFLDGFRADVRFFEFPGAGAGFAGETVKGYAVGDGYTAGVLGNGVQLVGIADDGELENDVWYSASYDVVAESTEGPTPFFGDFRASTFFTPTLVDNATVLIDGVSVFRALAADFNGDGILDCADVDALVAEIVAGSNMSSFDLTGDGLVDQLDLGAWLADAGEVNLPSGNPYLGGDANLDGSVDVSDFNSWNGNKFTGTAAWCAGDFNADGSIDVSDFNLWNGNKFQMADSSAVPVPEPAGWLLWPSLLLGFGMLRKLAGCA